MLLTTLIFTVAAGGEGVYLVVDEKSRFREDNFSKAMAALGSSALADAGACPAQQHCADDHRSRHVRSLTRHGSMLVSPACSG